MWRKLAFISAVIWVSYTILFAASAATPSNAERATASNALGKNTAEVTADKDMIYKVSFPTHTHACIDPGNLNGNGQVFSDVYTVENYGNSDIAIKIKNIQVICQGDEEIARVFETEDTASDSDADLNEKKIQIEMVWKNEAEKTERILPIEQGSPDKYVLFLKASKYSKDNQYVSLNNSSKGLFYFTGKLDINADVDWESIGITVKFDYEIEVEESDDGLDETELNEQVNVIDKKENKEKNKTEMLEDEQEIADKEDENIHETENLNKNFEEKDKVEENESDVEEGQENRSGEN